VVDSMALERLDDQGATLERAHLRPGEKLLVGRGELSDVRVRRDEDATVSDRHFEIWIERDSADQWVCHLRDLGSTNGTSIDGLAVDPQVARLVTVDSVIEAGRTRFRLTANRSQIAISPSAPRHQPAEPSLIDLAAALKPPRPEAPIRPSGTEEPQAVSREPILERWEPLSKSVLEDLDSHLVLPEKPGCPASAPASDQAPAPAAPRQPLWENPRAALDSHLVLPDEPGCPASDLASDYALPWQPLSECRSDLPNVRSRPPAMEPIPSAPAPPEPAPPEPAPPEPAPPEPLDPLAKPPRGPLTAVTVEPTFDRQSVVTADSSLVSSVPARFVMSRFAPGLSHWMPDPQSAIAAAPPSQLIDAFRCPHHIWLVLHAARFDASLRRCLDEAEPLYDWWPSSMGPVLIDFERLLDMSLTGGIDDLWGRDAMLICFGRDKQRLHQALRELFGPQPSRDRYFRNVHRWLPAVFSALAAGPNDPMIRKTLVEGRVEAVLLESLDMVTIPHQIPCWQLFGQDSFGEHIEALATRPTLGAEKP
jgi:hypothetical protein